MLRRQGTEMTVYVSEREQNREMSRVEAVIFQVRRGFMLRLDCSQGSGESAE